MSNTTTSTESLGRIGEGLETPTPQVWDLDEFVLSTHNSDDSKKDTLPAWITSLTEQDATRIFQASLGNTTQDETIIIDILRNSKIPRELRENSSWLIRTAFQLMKQEENVLRPQLTAWLQRNTDGRQEIPGTIIRTPNLLRMKERELLVKPTLNQIVMHHFRDKPDTAHNRTLADFGAWDGEITTSLTSHFSQLIAIEQNEERFAQLQNRSARIAKLTPMNMNIMDLPRLGSRISMDAALMSQVLYFLKDDQDLELIAWAVSQLKKGGLAMIVLNDSQPEPGSREDVRKTFNSKAPSFGIRRYATFLEKKNMGHRLLRPELRITASSESALIALTDIIRFLIPGEARHNESKIQEYVRRLTEAGSGKATLVHRLAILAASTDIQSEQEDWEFLQAIPESAIRSQSKSMGTSVRNLLSAPVTPKTANSDLPWPTFHKTLIHTSPGVILEFLERATEATEYGTNDQELGKILAQAGVSRVTYSTLLSKRTELEALVERGIETIESVLNQKKSEKEERGHRPGRKPKPTRMWSTPARDEWGAEVVSGIAIPHPPQPSRMSGQQHNVAASMTVPDTETESSALGEGTAIPFVDTNTIFTSEPRNSVEANTDPSSIIALQRQLLEINRALHAALECYKERVFPPVS